MAELESWRQILEEIAKIILAVSGEMGRVEANTDRLYIYLMLIEMNFKKRTSKCSMVSGIRFWRTEKGQ